MTKQQTRRKLDTNERVTCKRCDQEFDARGLTAHRKVCKSAWNVFGIDFTYWGLLKAMLFVVIAKNPI